MLCAFNFVITGTAWEYILGLSFHLEAVTKVFYGAVLSRKDLGNSLLDIINFIFRSRANRK